MTPDIARRCAVSLYAAMVLAVGCGLLVVAPFDWLAPLQQLPVGGGAVAGVLHAVLAGWAVRLTWRTLAAPGGAAAHAAPLRRPASLLLGMAVAMAWGVWMVHLQTTGGGDARALLWLQCSPLWLWPAGLGSPRRAAGGVARPTATRSVEPAAAKPRADAPEHLGDDLRPVGQVDMRRTSNVKGLRTGEHRGGRRKHDVVAVAEAAQEQAAA